MDTKALESLGFENIFDDIIATEANGKDKEYSKGKMILVSIGLLVLAIPIAIATSIGISLASIINLIKKKLPHDPDLYDLYKAFMRNKDKMKEISYPRGLSAVAVAFKDAEKISALANEFRRIFQSMTISSKDADIKKLDVLSKKISNNAATCIKNIKTSSSKIDSDDIVKFNNIEEAADLKSILESYTAMVNAGINCHRDDWVGYDSNGKYHAVDDVNGPQSEVWDELDPRSVYDDINDIYSEIWEVFDSIKIMFK